MKLLETHFDEYINAVDKANLHPKMLLLYNQFPKEMKSLDNMIFYGPCGVGKYSQMLYAIARYSPTRLKYEKKISISNDKTQIFLKISDIHFEVDMQLLGCASKLLWHEIYQQIVESISMSQKKSAFIVCKEFHNIHTELLDNFYSYMQINHSHNLTIRFILITEGIAFIPETILSCCRQFRISRPTKQRYKKCFGNDIEPFLASPSEIGNIKNIRLGLDNKVMQPHIVICNKLIRTMICYNTIQFLPFRDMLYDLFIYNLNIYTCIWYILNNLVQEGHLSSRQLTDVLHKTYLFLKYYNNNYRPIYHLEDYLYYLIIMIHGTTTTTGTEQTDRI